MLSVVLTEENTTIVGTSQGDRIKINIWVNHWGVSNGIKVNGEEVRWFTQGQEYPRSLMVDGRGGDDHVSVALFGYSPDLRVDGGGGDDYLYVRDADESVPTLRGGAGNDTLEVFLTPAVLIGGKGNDQLLGGNGADEMHGGPSETHLRTVTSPVMATTASGFKVARIRSPDPVLMRSFSSHPARSPRDLDAP